MKLLNLILESLQNALVVILLASWGVGLGLAYVFRVLTRCIIGIASLRSKKTYSGSIVSRFETSLLQAQNGLSPSKISSA